MTRAIVFVRSADFTNHAARCMQYCQDRGYQFKGLILNDWSAVRRMLRNDEASVALVSVEEELDPNRKPRIEVVANERLRRWDDGPTRPIHHRTARITRPGAGA